MDTLQVTPYIASETLGGISGPSVPDTEESVEAYGVIVFLNHSGDHDATDSGHGRQPYA